MINHVLHQLKAIAAAGSVAGKKKLLEDFMVEEDVNFRKVMQYMLNPFITFGITTFDSPEKIDLDEPYDIDQRFYNVMEDLRTRKLSGDLARSRLSLLEKMGVKRDLLLRVINKDPKAGFAATTLNKVEPNFLPTFPYMRCSTSSKSKVTSWKDGVYSQMKCDGMFINLNHDEKGQTWITTRQGNLLPNIHFSAIIAEVNRSFKPGTQTHGELLVYRDGVLLAREIGNGIITSIINGEGALEPNEVIHLMVWDQIPLTAVVPRGKYMAAYRARFQDLLSQLSEEGYIQPVEYRLVYSKEEAKEHFKEMLKRGFEGTVYKCSRAPWIDGTSMLQIKMKMEAECDLLLIGFNAGKGKHSDTFGSVICQSLCKKLVVNVSGMSDAKRLWIHNNRETALGIIMTVKYNMITSPSESNPLYSLFLPRMVELRSLADKHESDSLSKIQQDYADAMENV